MTEDDQAFLDQCIKDMEEAVNSFSNGRKAEGERWVATSFVENLNIRFDPAEIISPRVDPPDVEFRDARFEIKEIMDPGRKRHQEYRDELERLKKLTDPKDTLKVFRPKTMTITEVYQRCQDFVKPLQRKYPAAVRGGLDLLLYINLVGVMGLIEQPLPDTSALSDLGWRSVSFLKGQRSCCLYASDSAPAFLQDAVGRIWHLNQA
jgi:hypothetical protein